MNEFGGKWTNEKLDLIKKYLKAYATIMNKQNFKFAYIDAFAGSGYFRKIDNQSRSLFMPEFGVEEKHFFDGSARIALRIKPKFQHYIFVEKDENRSKQLEKLKTEFPDKADNIQVINEESNKYLQNICKKDWSNHRAVVFLDPYGMQVKWKTVEVIASTKAIDLWILFPLGQAINRLLKRDGNIRHSTKNTLTEFFGEERWFEEFYTKSTQLSIIEENIKKYQKNADFNKISTYFSERLNTIFKGRVSIPRPLYNSTNNPLFLLFFAAGNEKGARTAIKIANYILESK